MNLVQLENKYCYSDKRIELINCLKIELLSIQSYIDPLKIVIFGSFLNNVESPNDIDILAHGRVKTSKLSDYIKNGINFKCPDKIHVQRDFSMKHESEFKLMTSSEIVDYFNSLQDVKFGSSFVKNYIELVLT